MSAPILAKDRHWMKQSFLISQLSLETVDLQNSTFSSAQLKYTDTTLGGNFAINAPAQFTSWADIKAPSRTPNGKGMGEFYSEMIDDHNQVVHFRMGVARFNSLTTFFNSFYNTQAGQLARTGRSPDAFYYIGRGLGFVVSVMSFKLLAITAIGQGVRFFADMPSSRYYYHSPAMTSYWSAVTTMVNQISVNRGILPRIGGAEQGPLSDDYQFTQEGLARMHQMVPDVFRKDGGIDVYAMANKAQRLHRKRFKEIESRFNSMSSNENLAQILHDIESGGVEDDRAVSYTEYLKRWTETDQSKPKTTNGVATDVAESAEEFTSGFQKLIEFFEAESDDGGAFASFRVNYTGSVSESFSNQTGSPDIKDKINSMSASSRNVNFTLAEGNIAPGIDSIVGAVKGLVSGVADSMGIQGIAALGGAAFVDIPDVWQSSMANMPQSNYTIRLQSAYGNPISQLFDIYIPLCMLLAMALPLSSGKQSHTSPFLIEYYDQGRAQSRLGIIDNMTITRGVSSLGFTSEGHAVAIDVSFSIRDLTSIISMPINMGIDIFGTATRTALGVAAGSALGPLGAIAGGALALSLESGIFDGHNNYSDYLAVLAGMGLADQIYQFRNIKLRLTQKLAQWKSWASISHLASFLGETLPGRAWSALYKGTAR